MKHIMGSTRGKLATQLHSAQLSLPLAAQSSGRSSLFAPFALRSAGSAICGARRSRGKLRQKEPDFRLPKLLGIEG